MVKNKLPFTGHGKERGDKKAIIKSIKEQKFNLPSHISSDLKDLIWKIFEIKPENRLTFQEILDHPWFGEYGAENIIGFEAGQTLLPVNEVVLDQV